MRAEIGRTTSSRRGREPARLARLFVLTRIDVLEDET